MADEVMEIVPVEGDTGTMAAMDDAGNRVDVCLPGFDDEHPEGYVQPDMVLTVEQARRVAKLLVFAADYLRDLNAARAEQKARPQP